MKPNHLSTQRSAEIVRPIRLFALLGLLVIPATTMAGEIPRKVPVGTYAGLWNNSPFTSRPVVEAPEPVPVDNPLDDYALTGVSPVADGFRVTLINRNDPTERIVVDTTRANSNHDFEVLNINRSPGRPLSTTVELTDGRFTSTISFEQELLALRPPPAAAPPTPPQPGQPGADPQQNQDGQAPRRQPRPRVVPPPANAQQQAQDQQRGGRPQGAREQRVDRRGSRSR